ncbi:MAG: class I SAM-dependent methyltransferase, partial [bacterium]
QALPYPDASFDKSLALLVMNFIPDARKAASEMRRVTKPGGVVAAAVWDYGDGMTMLRTFWDAAVALDPSAETRHERRMPYCRKGELVALWTGSGLRQTEETSLVIPLDYESFEDYWQPFLTGQGPSGAYATSLPPERQRALRERLRRELLGEKPDMSFTLQARAWAVRGIAP